MKQLRDGNRVTERQKTLFFEKIFGGGALVVERHKNPDRRC